MIRAARAAVRRRHLRLGLAHPRSLVYLPWGTRAVAEDISRRLATRYRDAPTSVARVAGYTLRLNPADHGWISYSIAAGTFEIPLTELVKRAVHPGDTVIDVGANVGFYTLWAAARVGSGGRVVAFEPHPGNFELLRGSIEANGLGWVQPEPWIVSERSGSQTLYVSDDPAMTGQHSIVRHVGATGVVRPATTLDEYADAHGIGRIALLKVDVEGAEPRVLGGLRRRIESGSVDHVALEWNPEAWEDRTELLGLLFAQFDVYPIYARAMEVDPLPAPPVPPTTANLFLVRREGRPARQS